MWFFGLGFFEEFLRFLCSRWVSDRGLFWNQGSGSRWLYNLRDAGCGCRNVVDVIPP